MANCIFAIFFSSSSNSTMFIIALLSRMLEIRGSLASVLDGVHGLQLGVFIVELSKRADRNQLAAGADAEQRHRGIEQAVDIERVRVLGRAVRAAILQMTLDQPAHIVSSRISDRNLKVELVRPHAARLAAFSNLNFDPFRRPVAATRTPSKSGEPRAVFWRRAAAPHETRAHLLLGFPQQTKYVRLRLRHVSRRIYPGFLLLIRSWRPRNEQNPLLLTSRAAVVRSRPPSSGVPESSSGLRSHRGPRTPTANTSPPTVRGWPTAQTARRRSPTRRRGITPLGTSSR